MVHWVEKASLEKIRMLLEISEQERHYEVLLTLKNLADVRREHFDTTDLLSLIAGSTSPSGDPEAKTSNREQAS